MGSYTFETFHQSVFAAPKLTIIILHAIIIFGVQ